MKEKVLAILKPLVKDKGLSKQELEGLADIAAKNLSEDSTDEDINNAASGVVPFVAIMQQVGNRMASAMESKYKGWIDPSKVTPNNNPDPDKNKPTPDPSNALTAEQIQKMISDGIAAGLKPYQEREEKTRLQSLLYADERVKNIPEVIRSRYTLDKEENLDALASQIETDFAQLKHDLITSGTFAEPPAGGNGGGNEDEDGFAAFMKGDFHEKK